MITVYSKVGCPFCSLLKAELRKRNISYTEFDLTDDSIRQQFYAVSGTNTVPQVYVGEEATGLTKPAGVHIGGWTEVSANWQALENTG